MRATLLISAALLAMSPAAFAQAPMPNQAAAPVTPGAGVATDTPAATMAPTPKHHHHAMRVRGTEGEGGETWAHEPGTGMSGPASAHASNIDAGDSRSAIAPHLPMPSAGDAAGPWAYLHAADRALAGHRTGEAQQALEMAETRLLDRVTPVDQAGQPFQGPLVQQVSQARQALGHGDVAGARSAVEMALSHETQGAM